ncbi:hypothetical protein SLINC_5841 [Streptomyces lincolnensis]|uniref:Uncharacterized protein n=1 Tax=Streptomyces lincolnensis TaxID=1915 RepID=A0A1B1MHH0_STRLN|nr:GPP34 family phosphoprotein [Streptomyces lincolnensis]ANS68065.1 hypothetical protein SLINC_5841 [Streptomyces lincolnensis]AXG53729.1 hypothetical protein SLCG_2574 [Streptomyces lincolnensis]QMV09714.1 GPP34 family phosphoprotein [Streptomyces lincolnensis]
MSVLAQDLALLLLDDDTGRSTVDVGRRHRAVGSAILLDLARAGRLRVETPEGRPRDARPVVVDGPPTGDPVLDQALDAVAAKEMKLGWAAETIGHDSWRPLLDALVERGLLRHEKGRFLGLVRTNSWPAADGTHEAEVVGRIRAAVVDGQRPDETTVLLVMILRAIGALPAVLSAEDAKSVDERAKRLVEEYERGEGADRPWREVFKGLDTGLLVVLLAG